jgi:hypothetical protein
MEKTLKDQIADKQAEIDTLKKQLDSFALDPDDYIDQYNEMLNEAYGEVSVAEYTFDTSYLLKEVDEVAYREGLNDFVDSLDVSDDKGYKDLEEQLTTAEDELSDLEDMLEAEDAEEAE